MGQPLRAKEGFRGKRLGLTSLSSVLSTLTYTRLSTTFLCFSSKPHFFMSSLALGTVLAAVAFEAPHAVVVSRVGFAERTRAPCLCADPRSMSWQEGLESFLSPSTAQADREVLFKDLSLIHI